MSTFHFDIDSDGATTTEKVEAVDQSAAIRQALLLVSEILRDHALCDHTTICLHISVRGQDERIVWKGGARGLQPDAQEN
ncbi:hypothetical protein SGCZBJ_01695 [Caulobacter zeae]|uniref:DUF6894 domain-containing protein n=1 Tax=Caulobacter zeae TaxID=2055137 RepID=A0A2N5DRK8_9CAUL|nr:hypothetical protein [Caulobacter zeae]PLR28689.1 hypothetical protein SGCZBJ_01695 [Caulobacter zeae]